MIYKRISNLFLLTGVLLYTLGMALHPLYHHGSSCGDDNSKSAAVEKITKSGKSSLATLADDTFCPVCAGLLISVDLPPGEITAPALFQAAPNTCTREFLPHSTPYTIPSPRGPPAIS